MPDLDTPPAVADLVAQLASPSPMRRGSLSERFVKCSRQACACASHEDARHGPYFSLTRSVGGKTHSRFLSPEQAAVARRQIQAAHAFRRLLEEYWRACEEWADSEINSAGAASEAAEKRGSKGRLRARSSRRSRRS